MQSRNKVVIVVVAVVAAAAIGCCVALALASIPLLHAMSGSYVEMLGQPMAPNFESGQVVRVEAVSPADLQRGDVVVVEFADDSMVAKRLVGLPGETVEVLGGQVLIDGKLLDELYGVRPGGRDCGPVELPDDHYFILADNRGGSNDSRSFGPVPGEHIRRRVVQ